MINFPTPSLKRLCQNKSKGRHSCEISHAPGRGTHEWMKWYTILSS